MTMDDNYLLLTALNTSALLTIDITSEVHENMPEIKSIVKTTSNNQNCMS